MIFLFLPLFHATRSLKYVLPRLPRIILGFLNPSEYAVEGDKHKANGNINGFAWLSFTFCKVTMFFTFSK
jgi:hypothetical protein